MYYITYYYHNSLSITDYNVIKNILRESIFSNNTPQKKKKKKENLGSTTGGKQQNNTS
jgi:hypothetical protein